MHSILFWRPTIQTNLYISCSKHTMTCMKCLLRVHHSRVTMAYRNITRLPSFCCSCIAPGSVLVVIRVPTIILFLTSERVVMRCLTVPPLTFQSAFCVRFCANIIRTYAILLTSCCIFSNYNEKYIGDFELTYIDMSKIHHRHALCFFTPLASFNQWPVLRPVLLILQTEC